MRSLRAFTLIELLVVTAIIGILSSVVLASLSAARSRAENTALIAQGVEINKMIVACDAAGGKIVAPNSATAPSNDLCTLGSDYGKWPQAPRGFSYALSVGVLNDQNFMLMSNTGSGTYQHMYCGTNPGPPWSNACGQAAFAGLCRLSSTFGCTAFNRTTQVWE